MKEIIRVLKNNNIILADGMSDFELEKIEKLYNIEFPLKLKELYKLALPVSKGFYNWRLALQEENKPKFMKLLNKPFEEVREDVEEIDWVEKWGNEPASRVEVNNKIIDKLAKAPKLIPIYKHRYAISTSEENSPILSISGWDIIYYGTDLENYIEVEFGDFLLKDIDFSQIKDIDFWSDIM